MNDNRAASVARVKENDERLQRVTDANDVLENVAEQLENAWSDFRPLISYYESMWVEDLETLEHTPDGNYGVLSQDGVWNELKRFYQTLQVIITTATRIEREYSQSD